MPLFGLGKVEDRCVRSSLFNLGFLFPSRPSPKKMATRPPPQGKIKPKTSFRQGKTLAPIYSGGPVQVSDDGRWLFTVLDEEEGGVLVTDTLTGEEVGRLEGVSGQTDIFSLLQRADQPRRILLCQASPFLPLRQLPTLSPRAIFCSVQDPSHSKYTLCLLFFLRLDVRFRGRTMLPSRFPPPHPAARFSPLAQQTESSRSGMLPGPSVRTSSRGTAGSSLPLNSVYRPETPKRPTSSLARPTRGSEFLIWLSAS
jgi:hypothetical protein